MAWSKKQEDTEEEIEAKRLEALNEYGKEIAALKEEELALKNSIQTLKNTAGEDHAKRSSELELKEQDLSDRCSEMDKIEIEIKDKESICDKKLADLNEKTNSFEAYRKEEQARIDATNIEIATQKDILAKLKSAADDATIALSNKKLEIENQITLLGENKLQVEALIQESIEIKKQTEKDRADLQAEIQSHELKIKADADLRSEYISKESELNTKMNTILVFKSDLDEKSKRLNEYKLKLDEQSISLKSDRIALDNQIEEFKLKQFGLKTQIDKLEELKAQLQEKEK